MVLMELTRRATWGCAFGSKRGKKKANRSWPCAKEDSQFQNTARTEKAVPFVSLSDTRVQDRCSPGLCDLCRDAIRRPSRYIVLCTIPAKVPVKSYLSNSNDK
jgi:hypothetical protein